jgi:pyruvate/2-oxoglutarate dehydrogenase complex dihydrolipoamide acyltransferase (E2) component
VVFAWQVEKIGGLQNMNDNIGPYQVIDLTPGRRIWLNTLELSWTPHAIYGLLEVDVTVARKHISEHKARTGESLSFTAFLACCLARAVEEHKEVQTCIKGRRKLMIFEDVNIGLMVEHKARRQGALMGHVIQGANRKSYREIHDEIRSVQTAPVPPGRGMPSWFRSLMLLPWPFSRLMMAILRANRRRDPLSFVSMGGTVAITSVGMFGGGHSGWGLTPTPQSLGLVVGGIARKPAVVGERVEPREILNLTVMFDHDVVDGAPATRFTRRLVELIESGYGLDDLDVQ